jgi:LysR family transcriptional regulator, glycine cleavage system transcriptional activator
MHRLSGLPLRALRAFEAAARLGSFKSAAAEIGVTPAAVSHQVARLERHLGMLLFERLHRSIRLTDAGAQLADAAGRAFRGLDTKLAELSEQGSLAGPTTLSVTAAPSIAAKWLAPRLHLFQELHPRIEVRLNADDRRADLARDPGVDVALRYTAEPDDPALAGHRLWPPGKIIAVCAPALRDAGSLGRPRDVLAYPLLRTAQPASQSRQVGGGELSSWKGWLAAAGVEGEAPASHLFGNTQLAIEAAAAGRGFALAPAILVESDLRSGRLIQPFPIALDDPYSYWIFFRRDRGDEARIRLFVRWIRQEAAQS